VIDWLNGPFGCGKTTTAAELRSLIPSSRLFDPETVGYMLRPHLADHPVSNYQHWPPWGPLVVATATELARFTNQHLIAPQTILARSYLEQIFAGLRDSGQPCSMSSSMPMKTYCASTSTDPAKHKPGAWPTWRRTAPRARGCLQRPTLSWTPEARPPARPRTRSPTRCPDCGELRAI
jgi:hypothetical protein